MRIMILYGNNLPRKEKFIEELKSQHGAFTFTDQILHPPSLCDWLIVKNHYINVINYINKYNIVIICTHLFQVPLEIRVKAEKYLMEFDFVIPNYKNAKRLLWSLIMQKYISKDLLNI